MPTNTMTTVSTHSRKGGVGKTSIILSAAIQLAAKGKKVAVLDLDTQGAYLSQALPLRRDFLQDSNPLQFDLGRNELPHGSPYAKRPWLSWIITGDPFKRPKTPFLKDCGSGLAIDESLRENLTEPLRKRIEHVQDKLTLFLLSPYIRDLDHLNKFPLSLDGQKRYRAFLSRTQGEMRDLGYEYLFLDNSSGLSFVPGNSLTWVLERARSSEGGPFITWLVTGAPWWEQALVIYEVNIYPGALARASPTLIINRAAGPWMGKNAFKPGQRVAVGENPKLRNEFASKSFAIPVWFASVNKQFRSQDLIPNTMSVAILGESTEVKNASLRPEDVQVGERDKSEKGSVTETEGGARDDPGEVLVNERLSDLFANWSMKFIRDFVLKAAVCEGKGETFHDHVRLALVSQLVPEECDGGEAK
jgi:CobQ/CobB/MinD/ParA nucleotide binding domain